MPVIRLPQVPVRASFLVCFLCHIPAMLYLFPMSAILTLVSPPQHREHLGNKTNMPHQTYRSRTFEMQRVVGENMKMFITRKVLEKERDDMRMIMRRKVLEKEREKQQKEKEQQKEEEQKQEEQRDKKKKKEDHKLKQEQGKKERENSRNVQHVPIRSSIPFIFIYIYPYPRTHVCSSV